MEDRIIRAMNLRLNNLLVQAGFIFCVATAFAAPKKIVLIAGSLDSHAPGTHEYEQNILLLKHCLETSPSLTSAKCEVHFNGWPQQPAALDDADTILLTSGGSDRNEADHPLYVGDRFAQLEKQMNRGCGLVLIHWSTFHPARVGEKVLEFAGGYFDYENGTGGPTQKWFSKIETRDWTTQIARVRHPVAFGLKPFQTKEEFYFNVRFRENDPRLTPIVFNGLPGSEIENTVAWALQRENGGRSFGTTGGHFFTNWWNADFRKMVLNAIVWTAGLEVPANGVESKLEGYQPGELHKPVVVGDAPADPNNKQASPSPLAGFAETNSSSVKAASLKILPANPDKDPVKDAKEDDWRDARWNQMDVGQILASLVSLPNGTVAKGLTLKVGEKDEGAVCYDTFLCNVRGAWTPKFLEFDSMRYGLLNTPKPAADLQFVSPAGGAWNGTPRYRGLYINEKRVVLSYQLGDVEILESPWLETDGDIKVITRSFTLGSSQPKQFLFLAETRGKLATNEIEGISIISFQREGKCVAAAVSGDAVFKLNGQEDRNTADPNARTLRSSPNSEQNGKINLEIAERDKAVAGKVFLWSGAVTDLAKFAAMVKKSPPAEDLRALSKGGNARWGDALETKGSVTVSSSEPYVVDTITVPYENPYKALMFLSGVDFLENGEAAVCSIHGDVWIVSGIDEKLERVKWKRFATGLFQPLGLKVVKNEIYVLGRDQITRLHDRNRDGEADFYENFCSKIKTSVGGHDYVTSLETDVAGNFYYVDPSGVHRVSSDGSKHETIAKGWRNPNGMGVGPDGVITVAPQEGNWTPASAIFEVKPNGFYGFGGPEVTPERPLGYDLPLCWIPRNIDNSTASQVWVTSDRWGPLRGQMLNLSFGRCAMMLVLRETVNDTVQGGVVPLKPRFLSGAMRGTFRKQDGQLYVVGANGWQTAATRDGSFQRVRYTGQKVYLPTALHVLPKGIELVFSQPLDRETAEDAGSYSIEQWNYHYRKEYGSKEYSVASPKKVGHDPVEVKSAKVGANGHSVFLEIDGLQPVMQMQIRYNVNAADGKAMRGEVCNTINRVGK